MRNNKKLIFIIIVLFSILCSSIIMHIFWKKNIYQDDQLRKCKILSQKYRDVCLYETAIKTAYINTSKALFICSIIKDKYNNGRCYSDIIAAIEDNNPAKINESLVICKNIKHIFWKSECYFNVAESVYTSFLNPKTDFINKSKINLALDICEKSTLLVGNCYFKVIGGLNPVQINNISKYRSKEYKNIGYRIGGVNLGRDIFSPENQHKCLKNFNGCYVEAFNFCQSIEEKYKSDCNIGLWSSLGYGNLLNICKSINKTYKKDCNYSLGIAISTINYNPSLITCEIVKEDYQIDCYEGFFETLVN